MKIIIEFFQRECNKNKIRRYKILDKIVRYRIFQVWGYRDFIENTSDVFFFFYAKHCKISLRKQLKNVLSCWYSAQKLLNKIRNICI